MNLDQKIDPRAVLQQLPSETQDAIIQYLDGGDGVKGHSLRATVKWLHRQRIEISREPLRMFRQWYLLRQKLNNSSEISLQMAEECQNRGWVKSAKEVRTAAQVFFNNIVIEKGDPKLWCIVERVNLFKDKVELDQKKLKLLSRINKAKTAKSKTATNDDTGLTPEEKEAAVRQILGIS
jgi:hypothetical protein